MKKIVKWIVRILIVLAVLVVIVVGGMLYLVRDSNPQAAVLDVQIIDAKTLKINGEIDKATALLFLDAMSKQEELETIIISSGGGDVGASLLIAEQIHNRKIKLVIEKYCMSSCFNYFVLAAAEVKIEENAVLGFHGTPQTFPFVIRLFTGKQIKKEKAFLRKLGLSNDIFAKLASRRDDYTYQKEMYDMTFWLVGAHFFETNGLKLRPNSYFPNTQIMLEQNVENVLADPYINEGTNLVMYGMFE